MKTLPIRGHILMRDGEFFTDSVWLVKGRADILPPEVLELPDGQKLYCDDMMSLQRGLLAERWADIASAPMAGGHLGPPTLTHGDIIILPCSAFVGDHPTYGPDVRLHLILMQVADGYDACYGCKGIQTMRYYRAGEMIAALATAYSERRSPRDQLGGTE